MRRGNRAFLLVCALVLAPLCLLGYGGDNDTYTMLDAGRLTWHFGLAATSRNPGYWAYEAVLYVLARLGGFALSNGASLAVGLVVVWRFLRIAERSGVRYPRIVAAALVATPVFAIAATSSVDFFWSLAGVVLFTEMLVTERWGWAVLAGAMAFALRGADGTILAGAIIGAMMVRGARRWKLLAVGVGAALLGGLVYAESWRVAGHGFGFLRALNGDAGMWSAGMRVGRFGYKALYLFGPVAAGVLLVAVLLRERASAGDRLGDGFSKAMTSISTGIVLANVFLFLVWPIEISYLLPTVFFGLLLLGWTLLARQRWVAVAFLLAVVSLDLVTPQLAAPNIPGRASAARFRPGLEAGTLVQDVRLRWGLRACSDYDCYYRHFHQDASGIHYDGPQLVRPSR